MIKQFTLAAAAATAIFAAAPATAAEVIYAGTNPGGLVTLTTAGAGAVASPINFDVQGTGDFTAIFTFVNPFNPARATGSASFDFDPDVLTFTGGKFSSGGTFALGAPGSGSAITVSRMFLSGGDQTLTIFGKLNSVVTPEGGNNFARIGGSLNLVELPAVPEPSTWAMFILGFGLMGAGLRRRNAKVTSAKASLHFA